MDSIIQGDEIPMHPMGDATGLHELGESHHDMGYGFGRQVGENVINSVAKWVKDNPYTAGGLGTLAAGGAALALAPELAVGGAGVGAAEALGIAGEMAGGAFEGADVDAFLSGMAL